MLSRNPTLQLPTFLALIVITALSTATAQIELITNGGFVQGNLAPWICANDGTNTCGVLVSAPPAPDFLTFLDPGATLAQSTIAGDQIPYLMSYDSYCTNTLNATFFNCTMPLNIQLGDQLAQDNIDSFIRHFQHVLTPFGKSLPLQLGFGDSPSFKNEQVYVDNISLIALANGPAYNNAGSLLSNGGFELSTAFSGPDHGWKCLPGGCCDVEGGNLGQFAKEGMNYVNLPAGCQLVQDTPLMKDTSYNLQFYGYCLQNNSGCNTPGNVGIKIGNNVNNFQDSQNFSFNLGKGDPFVGPYGQFSQVFTAMGNDTISITASFPIRLDNFTVFPTADTRMSPSSLSTSSSSHTGPIVGAIVGALALLGIGALGYMLWRRRQQRAGAGGTFGVAMSRNKGGDGTVEEKGSFLPTSYSSFNPSAHQISTRSNSPPLSYNAPALPPTRDEPSVWESVSPPPDSVITHQPGYTPSYGGRSEYGGGSGPRPSFVPEIQDAGSDAYPHYPSYSSYR